MLTDFRLATDYWVTNDIGPLLEDLRTGVRQGPTLTYQNILNYSSVESYCILSIFNFLVGMGKKVSLRKKYEFESSIIIFTKQ